MKHIFKPIFTSKNILINCSFLLLILTFFYFPSLTQAASLGLGIYPPVISIQAKPPVHISTPLTIINETNNSITAQISYKLFTAGSNQNGELTFLPEKNLPYPDQLLFKKVKIYENNNAINTITLDPNQQKKLNLDITLPKNEALGDYYFSIIFASTSTATIDKTSLGAIGGIGTNVLLSIGPKGKAQGRIQQFSTPQFINSGPVPFILLVNNTGSHIINPQGFITITNMFNQTIGKVTLLPVNILEHSVRAIPDSTNSQEVPVANPFLPDIPIAVWPEHFLLGPYTATVQLSLSENGPIIKNTTHFFAFPIIFLIFIFFVIIISVIIFLRVKSHINRG